ncbi:Rv3654c family TadE-like protein [Nesterenkonia xinjiangensis]|uniref:Secretion/DNA translocation related TadE-like protein n=1 Tax=Nesterenkonia xinjiangensis TaxID=225327 RepID=A0A7Z0GKJ4_9MICC|nr:Rv3654c family TadE-like protein [Nesterenkonia xinjiangensis]NYJ77685.1 secretion/DNA translocation related TadE-like protein [Nesterenkonia xinjiangensis]
MSGAPFREERGSGTVLVLAMIAALVMLIGVVHVLGTAAVAAAQAARGADLAALAGADAARGLTPGDPCTVAEAVAERNVTRLDSCQVTGRDGTEVFVSVSVGVPVLPASLSGEHRGPWEAARTARAGPPSTAEM